MAFDTVVYLDPVIEQALFFDAKEFSQPSSFSKKSFIGSRIFYDDLISHSFKVPKNQSKEEISASIEIRMYEDLGLDLQKTYSFVHVVKDLEYEDMLLIEAFALEHENSPQDSIPRLKNQNI
ncbi:MAG: hypothetical protein IBX44_07095 [Sulfurospirillum sp.]|nr:hypothetical protein [Sulfurospirillum sp.]